MIKILLSIGILTLFTPLDGNVFYKTTILILGLIYILFIKDYLIPINERTK